jgi:sugar lactone lactonase YvrE
MKKLFAIIVLTTLSACANPSISASQFSPASAAGNVAHAGSTFANLYVAEVCGRKNDKCKPANGLVETLGGATITDGINQPWSLTFDTSGNLYVGNEDETNPTGTVTEYAPGSTSPSRTISNLKYTPRALAIDASNDLFVVGNAKAGCCGFEAFGSVYGPTGQKVLGKLTGFESFPERPAFDSQGNLYVPSFETFPGEVGVYPPGAKKPTRAIVDGIGFPKALAFDASGNLYVLNNTINHSSDVTVYAPGSSSVMRTIASKGMKTAYTMALDAQDNVYVANDSGRGVPNSVLVYAAGGSTLVRSITSGVKYPVGLAFDASGNLYVANAPRRGKNTVTEYAPGTSTPSNTYTLKESPTQILMGP